MIEIFDFRDKCPRERVKLCKKKTARGHHVRHRAQAPTRRPSPRSGAQGFHTANHHTVCATTHGVVGCPTEAQRPAQRPSCDTRSASVLGMMPRVSMTGTPSQKKGEKERKRKEKREMAGRAGSTDSPSFGPPRSRAGDAARQRDKGNTLFWRAECRIVFWQERKTEVRRRKGLADVLFSRTSCKRCPSRALFTTLVFLCRTRYRFTKGVQDECLNDNQRRSQ